MKSKNRASARVILLLLVSVVFLSACRQESPDGVIKKFKKNLTEVQSGKVDFHMVMKGNSEGDTLDFEADLSVAFNHRDEEAHTSEVGVAFGGEMVSEEETVSGKVDLTIRTIGDDYYLRLDEAESDDERYTAFKPFVTLYMKKWLHVASELIPENVRELNAEGEAMDEKREQAKQLFLDSRLFVVQEDLGIEEINGKETYHYVIAMDEEGVQEYVANAARLDGRELTLEEIQEASKMARAIERAELWIGTDDHYAYKAMAVLSSDALGVANELGASPEADMRIEMTMVGSDYNGAVQINAPLDSTEFNPLELMMGASDLNLSSTEEVMIEGEAMMEKAEEEVEAMEKVGGQ